MRFRAGPKRQPTRQPPTESASSPRPARAKPRSPSTTCPPSRSTRRTSTSPARLAVSHHIDSRPAPPSAGASFGLVVITPATYDPKAPHHDLDDEAEMCHVNVEYWPTSTAVH